MWLVAFYAVWAVLVATGGRLEVALAHWPIAVAMAIGSYVAGSTPMGGGTVGFPMLVLLFDQPAAIGRGFSFAVQSVGMVSASILIVCRRQPVAWGVLRWAMLGALVGTPLGLWAVAPWASDAAVKLVFAVLWASFGVMTLVKIGEMSRYSGWTPLGARGERAMGLFVGVFGGGTVAALTGVGIDMLLYTGLVLVCRADLKIAVPTSVILMAFTSLVGVVAQQALQALDPATHAQSPEVFANWLAAAPIVALGAPLGVVVVDLVGRVPTLLFVAVLCLLQLVWTVVDLALPAEAVGLVLAGVLLANACFHALHALGGSLAERRAAPPAAGEGGAGN
ncbi:MAG: sulfite exporter TauE/SafE family protein [Planctomycetota bacterium]